ncbi:MAG: cellulase family glycosylhydrolase [Balneolia bacterium]|nr:cellulase family glycosylhydrolase [Balneolia bacterium]
MKKKLKLGILAIILVTALVGCDSINQHGQDNSDSEELIPVLISPENGAEYTESTLFKWKGVKGIDTYRFQLSANNEFDEIVRDTLVNGRTYLETRLSQAGQYHWRVKAQNTTGSRAWSAAWVIYPPTDPIVDPIDDFVRVENGRFTVGGEPIRFVGTNAYYLPNYQKLNEGVVNRAFNSFEEAGINVIRMWAFYDGYDCGYSQNDPNENVIQTSPGVYSESALQDLDKVIAKGKERNMRFILPFVNYWDELGGICQYNTWAGADNPRRNMDFFINNEETQQWFRDYIEMLLNRVNTVTGIAYKDEPAIMAWQVMNEGRNRNQPPEILRDWYQEIAQFIKSIDGNHLVSTGEEGFDEGTPSEYSVSEYSNTYVLRAQEGTSYIMNTAIPEIDFGSAHWYPQDFGFGQTWSENVRRAQEAWLTDHKNIANSMGKPFILGEWGHHNWTASSKNAMYNHLYQHAEEIGLDASMIWQLTADGEKCWEFAGNICYPGGRTDTELFNNFRNHAQAIRSMED